MFSFLPIVPTIYNSCSFQGSLAPSLISYYRQTLDLIAISNSAKIHWKARETHACQTTHHENFHELNLRLPCSSLDSPLFRSLVACHRLDDLISPKSRTRNKTTAESQHRARHTYARPALGISRFFISFLLSVDYLPSFGRAL